MVEPLNPHHLDPSDPHNLQETDEPVLERITIATEGEDCDACVRKLRPVLMKIPGVLDVIVDLPDEIEAIITVTRGEDVSKGGAVFLNDRMELIDLREKAQPREAQRWSGLSEHAVPYYNAGLYAFRPSIFEFTAKLRPSPRGEYELTDAIRALAHSEKKVRALELTGEWADVRDPEILARLNR